MAETAPDDASRAGAFDGDDGFTAFFRTYHSSAMAFASLVADAGTDFEDAVGDAFLEVFARWDAVEHPARYLYAAIRNALRNPRLGRERATHISDRHARMLFLVARSVDPAEAAEVSDLMAILQENLTENQRIAFYLKVEAGWRAADIAKVLRCSTATVRVHLSKAYRRLRAAHKSVSAGMKQRPVWASRKGILRAKNRT